MVFGDVGYGLGGMGLGVSEGYVGFSVLSNAVAIFWLPGLTILLSSW